MFSTIGYYISVPFAWLLRQLYTLTGSYGMALILFTLVVKLVLLPFQLKSKKSMIRMNRFQPVMKELQARYANNPTKYNEEIQKLYREEGISPMGGCLWSFLPLPIMIALYSIIRMPLSRFMMLSEEVITEIPEDEFYAAIPVLREKCGDRAVMRAIHEYNENRRVVKQVEALESGDFDTFLKLTKESGFSSWMYLQNVIPAGYVQQQAMAIALGLCEHYLQGRGAYRVHGGGFAGTVQAFVPCDILDQFKAGIDAALGEGACHILSIRPQGGVEMEV